MGFLVMSEGFELGTGWIGHSDVRLNESKPRGRTTSLGTLGGMRHNGATYASTM